MNKQSSATVTITHNLGRANRAFVQLNLGTSTAYAWGNTGTNVYNVTNNSFQVYIYNNGGSNGTFSFYWLVVPV